MYKIPASKGHLAANRFKFQAPGSKTVLSVPKSDFVTLEQRASLLSIESALDPKSVLADAFGGDVAEVLVSLEADQLEAFMTAWQADSGLDEGKSEGSSD